MRSETLAGAIASRRLLRATCRRCGFDTYLTYDGDDRALCAECEIRERRHGRRLLIVVYTLFAIVVARQVFW